MHVVRVLALPSVTSLEVSTIGSRVPYNLPNSRMMRSRMSRSTPYAGVLTEIFYSFDNPALQIVIFAASRNVRERTTCWRALASPARPTAAG
jgi:hypothetical protein